MKSPWTIGIGTTLFGFILTVVYDVFKQKNIFSTFLSLLNWIWNGIIAILIFELKIWWLLIFVALVIGLMYLYVLLIKRKDDAKPLFLEYTQDRLKEWKWSWSWQQEYFTKKWGVENLIPHCPKCDTHMLVTYYGSHYMCPRCNFDSSLRGKSESSHEVEALIYDNVRRKYFTQMQICERKVPYAPFNQQTRNRC